MNRGSLAAKESRLSRGRAIQVMYAAAARYGEAIELSIGDRVIRSWGRPGPIAVKWPGSDRGGR
jgi:hypothetical protein